MNIWDCEGLKVIPTNLKTRSDGSAVMGAGLAKQAAQRKPGLSNSYGRLLKNKDFSGVLFYEDLVLFPTKDDWRDPSDPQLIEHCLEHVVEMLHGNETIWFPRIGCGLGGLDWNDVKPLILTYIPRALFTHP